MQDVEIWKPIINFETRYEISNHGRVRNINKRRIKKLRITKGYYFVDINVSKDISKRRSVSKLVATHFIPNPDNLPIVNHIDGNQINNHYSNLEWCTQQQNCYHAKHILRHAKVISYKRLIQIFDKYKGSSIDELREIILASTR